MSGSWKVQAAEPSGGRIGIGSDFSLVKKVDIHTDIKGYVLECWIEVMDIVKEDLKEYMNEVKKKEEDLMRVAKEEGRLL